jgi:hypothetical protein
MKRYVPTGLSLPIELMEKIDSDRKDVSRSRFLLRLLEKAYNTNVPQIKEANKE